MLSPAITVTVSLVLVAAIGYVVGRLHEEHPGIAPRDPGVERLRADLRVLEDRYAGQAQERAPELATAQQSTSDRTAETERLQVDLSLARTQLEQRRAELDAALEAAHDADAKQQSIDVDLARVREELETSRQALADSRRETAEIEHGYSAQIEQRAAHADELQAARERSEARCNELQNQLQDRGRKLEEALTARGEGERQASEREQHSETLHDQLNEALQHAELERVATNAILAEVTAVGQRTQGELESAQLEVESLQLEVDQLTRTLAARTAELAEAEGRGERRLRERSLEVERVTELLRSREEELEQNAQLAVPLLEQVAAEETRRDTRDQRIAVLEQEQQRLLEIRDRLLREVHDREEEVRQLRVLVDVAPKDQDDLEAIDGIGPSIATLLQSVGVRSFRQIAAWDRRTMGWLAAREPQLKGRLRVEWVAEARQAHADKYGKVPD